MLKVSKKYVKVVSVVVATAFVLGIVGIALTQTTKSFAAGSSASTSNVGIVSMQTLITNHPDYQKNGQTLQAEADQKKKELEAKLATLTNDQDKQAEYVKFQEWVNTRQKQLMDPIIDQVKAAIKQVADTKGLSVVLDVNTVVYGGQDITDEVGKKIAGK